MRNTIDPMITKKVTCEACGWSGYKSLDQRSRDHHLTCPKCKTVFHLGLSLEEVAMTEAARREAQIPPAFHVRLPASA